MDEQQTVQSDDGTREFEDEQPTAVVAYEPIGREALRQRANRPTEVQS